MKMHFTTVDMTPRIGTEVKCNLATLLDGSIAKELRELLEQRGVLFFRGHAISDEQQIQFGATLGAIRQEHGAAVMKVSAEKELSPIFAEYTQGTYFFHIDGTYTDMPALASILRARVVAPQGGQTEFCNTYALYDALSETDKKLLEGLEAVHSQEMIQRRAFPDPTEEQLAIWGVGSLPEKNHPMVWHHRSGRKSLLLANTISRFVGMDPTESDALLDRLLTMADDPQYIYTHDWQVGDMLIWDNTGTMHRVVPFDLGCGRELHRVTLVGEEPIAAPRKAFA
jgi:alpha-ketoglutarate-dependent taurine dioxygenase